MWKMHACRHSLCLLWNGETDIISEQIGRGNAGGGREGKTGTYVLGPIPEMPGVVLLLLPRWLEPGLANGPPGCEGGGGAIYRWFPQRAGPCTCLQAVVCILGAKCGQLEAIDARLRESQRLKEGDNLMPSPRVFITHL